MVDQDDMMGSRSMYVATLHACDSTQLKNLIFSLPSDFGNLVRGVGILC